MFFVGERVGNNEGVITRNLGQAAILPELASMAVRMRSRLRRAASRSGVLREMRWRFLVPVAEWRVK